MKTVISTALALVVAAGLAAAPAAAQTETMDISYQWTAPSTGTAVDHYVIEHSVDGGSWATAGTVATNTATLALTVGVSHQVRVAGVDAGGRQGPFSAPSDPYTPDAGAPGAPGKPIVF